MAENKYWQGLDELHQDPGFEKKVQNEFAGELPVLDLVTEEAGNNPTKRRDFLKYLGFSVGAATLAASCEMPIRKAIPHVIAPEKIIPGMASYFASTFADGSDYSSILVKTRDGRPIKIEGNKLSQITKGGTTARVQASLLSLYEGSRKKYPSINGTQTTWKEIDNDVPRALNHVVTEGKQIIILTHSVLSPATKQVIEDFKSKYPNTKHVQYDPVSYSGILDANADSFGSRAIPSYHFDKADVIVSFGADFLGTWVAPSEFMPDYSINRKINAGHPKMSRHIQFESTLSLTGSNADMRYSLKPSDLRNALLKLYNEIAGKAGASRVSGVKETAHDEKLKQTANELWDAQGASIVVSGSNDKNEQVIVNAINDLLNNYGNTLDWGTPTYYKQGSDSGLSQMINDTENNRVGAILVHGCNPAYDHPLAASFIKAIKDNKISLRINFGIAKNDTDEYMHYSCPSHHYLESWSDAEPIKGHYSLGQPAIRNIFDTRQFEDTLMVWTEPDKYWEELYGKDGEENDSTATTVKMKLKPYKSLFYDYLVKYWEDNIYNLQSKHASFNDFWDASLHDGIFDDPNPSSTEEIFTGDTVTAGNKIKSSSVSGYELVIYEKVGIGNGQYFDNPWLQEMPDPITKATWDNYLLMSVADAGREGLSLTKTGHVYNISVGGTEMSLPVIVQPGQAEGTLAVALGYGRKVSGKGGKEEKTVGIMKKADDSNPIGVDVYPVIDHNGDNFLYSLSGVSLESAGRKQTIAQTQTHHIISSKGNLDKRTVIKEGILPNLDDTVEHIKEQRKEFKHLNEQTLYPGHQEIYASGHHWKMAIDLNSCIGCNACVVACTAENNVPVVGKTEVSRAHEMHWLRIDRYYTGEDGHNPDVIFQPMLCQHCDNAPCENVCPVSATNHSTEGLNQMAYNRCIGTRYCENNCPYKVRRFNWYDYMGADSFFNTEIWNNDVDPYEMTEDLTRMVLNPDVTVRSRGVMEKCSFCVQRIQEGKLNAKKETRKLNDDDIHVACQQACPTNAIEFGDYNDPESAVRHALDGDGRTYFVIEEINTASSIGYQAKIRNRSEEEDTEKQKYVLKAHGHHNDGDHKEEGHEDPDLDLKNNLNH